MSVTLHTDLGDLKLEVFCDLCPKASENFLALAASGYYDGCLFHRSIPGFMVQTGDPSSHHPGKGGTSIWGRPFADEIRTILKHGDRGVLAMANKGPDTNLSQFYITYAKQPHLDGKYTIFGKVLDGWETLDALEAMPIDGKNRPTTKVRIQNITIHANPLAG